MKTDTIHCYYRELNWPEQSQLLQMWVKAWEDQGWKTRVLGPHESMRDSRYRLMVEHSQTVPCVNDRWFERVNFCRWLAFSHIDGAIADFDVFPIRPFPPMEFKGFTNGSLVGNPGFVVGTRHNFSAMADTILGWNADEHDIDPPSGKPHVSDMTIMMRTKERFDHLLDLVQGYRDPGWERGPLVHFCNRNLDGKGNGKAKEVERLLQRHYQV